MQTYILKEDDWNNFIQEHILEFCVQNNQKAKVLALVGDLGAGKTTFSKTFLHTLGVTQHVQSPTFSIINSYDISFGEFEKVFHMDIYRIEDTKELEVLHIDEIFNNPKNIIVIEWADKIKSIIPEDALWIYFEHQTTETRKVSVEEKK